MEAQGLLVYPRLCENAAFSLAELAGERMSLMGMNKMARNGEELPGRQGWNGEPCCGHPICSWCPCQSWGKHQPPNQRAAVWINMKLGCWSRRGSRHRSEQYFFSKESTFSKQPTKRCDLLHTTALAKYNLSCLKFSLILCMCHDFQETKKRKKTLQILRKSV